MKTARRCGVREKRGFAPRSVARTFVYRCTGEANQRGYLVASVEPTRWVAQQSFVDERFRRQGIATRLYEKMAQEACASGVPLVSMYRAADAHSGDFWRKLHAKGKAVVLGRRKGQRIYAAVCAHAKDLSGIPKKKRKKARR